MMQVTSAGLQVLDPTAGPVGAGNEAPHRLATLRGKQIGVIWNNKQPGEFLLKEMIERLAEQYGAVAGPFFTKPYLGNVAPPEILESLESCDAVVSGVGDCGSCMSANVLDAIEMERRGVPAVGVGTERLAETTGRGMARFHGVPDFPIAIIRSRPVRLEGLNKREDREKVVEEFLPQVVSALLTGRAD
jgi:hypothetical protein